jgi:hypothetical protein
MSNVEGMYSIYFIKKSVSEAIPPFDIQHSIFFGSAVRFLLNVVSYKVSEIRGQTTDCNGWQK